MKLRFQSDPRMLCVIRGALGPLAESLGLPEDQCRSVILAVDEALSNVIRHAYSGQPDRPLAVSFYRLRMTHDGALQDSLKILVLDRGLPIKKEHLQGRPLDDVRPGGLGLHFIHECMDRVEFRHDKGVNYLRMVKILGPPQSQMPIEGAIECK